MSWILACTVMHLCGGQTVVGAPQMPSSTPAFVVRPDGASAAESAILDAAGNQVMVTISADPKGGGFLLRPSVAPLKSGAYTVHRVDSCGVEDTPVEIVESAPFPTSVGTVAATTSIEEIPLPSAAECHERGRAAVARLTLTPSPELARFGELVQYTAVVDGVEWARSAYGAPFAQDAFGPNEQHRRTPGLIYAACDHPPELGVREGTRRGFLYAHIAGAGVDPMPTPFEFELSCTPPKPKDGGCSVGGGGLAPFWLILPLLVLRRRLS